MPNRSSLFALGCLSAIFAAPALADVKDGVDAWSRQDYTAAIAQWEGPAAAGDADALFNLGQAYRLGRGVAVDPDKAEQYYAKAAAKGHLQAADIYGLLLFQRGQRQAALPYIQDAARRGDPRSQYLLGIAYFNGDIVSKDWVRAYALLTLANGQGLPQATPAIAEMDKYIPLDQRQKAASLAVQLQQEADQARAQELASADLALSGDEPAPAARPAAKQIAAIPAPAPRVPQPIAAVPVEPSAAPVALADARDAIRQASLAAGTENPAEAGADYARPALPAPKLAPKPTAPPPVAPKQAEPKRVAVDSPAPVTAPAVKAPKPAAPAKPAPAKPALAAKPAANGEWKIQLGAFGVQGNAEKLWTKLSSRPELAGKKRLLVPAGGLTKLLAGGFASQADAAEACSRLKQAGQTCLVTK